MSVIAWSSSFSPIAGLDLESELRQQLDCAADTGTERRLGLAPAARIGLVPVAAPGDVDAALRLNGIGKRYGTREVLSDFNMQIERGSFVAIVGRSGCGKSTLLRLLAGLERADAGTLQTVGRDGDLHTRIMFQDARLLPWKSVLQNVMLGLPRRPAAQSLARARAVLDEVGLSERANDWPAQLSGGQRQRVALARALVHQPELLLLDEPLGALDALTRIEMHALIERLWREHGFTAVLVTHDVHEAVALGDRVVLIEAGRIALDQAVTLARPRTRDTAAFAALEGRVLQRVLHGEASGQGTN
jgi:sulfonate transport system ATP-binding protein